LGHGSPRRGRRCRLRLRLITRWFRYHESDPVGSSEWILRVIPAAYYDRSLPLPITPQGFQPHKDRDADGLSFFREDFVSPGRLAQSNDNPKGCCVARIRVSYLLALGLSVSPSPDPDEQAGHVTVRELGYPAYKAAKNTAKDLHDKLARAASIAIASYKSPLKP
jgi:hypothetical protein